MSNKTIFVFLFPLFFLFSCSSKKQEVLYELKPDETVAMIDEHYLAVFSDKVGHYLFTKRGKEKETHFIFNGKEVGSFDTIFRCLPPDIIFLKKGKRYRFDPYREKLLGPYDYFDGMGVDVIVNEEHLAVIGVRDNKRTVIVDGEEQAFDIDDDFNNYTLHKGLQFNPDNTWKIERQLNDSTISVITNTGKQSEYKGQMPIVENRGELWINVNHELIRGEKPTGIKGVKIFEYNAITGSTLALDEQNRVFFNNKSIGSFDFPFSYYYTSRDSAGIITNDSIKEYQPAFSFVDKSDHFYFTILKEGKEYYRVSNGKEIAKELHPVFSMALDIAYIKENQVFINDKLVGEGFSLVFDSKANGFKWLSLSENKIMLNSASL